MELNEKQKQGLEIAIERYNNKQRYTVISGYAGSGKTTLVKFIIAALPDIDPEKDVVYTSFTGKATSVLSKKGNPNTQTLHKLLYDSVPKPEGGYLRKKKSSIEFKIVVVDEISMVPNELIKDLARHDIYMIGLGDPFQLPPINKNDDNGLLASPHIFLDEIMRQAQESEIIRLSMKIRNRESIELYNGTEVKVVSKEDLNTGMLQWADQILVATNKTRKNINNQMRTLLGRGNAPEDGDKVICCRNYWEDITVTNNHPLVNGTIGYLEKCKDFSIRIPYTLSYLHHESTIDCLYGNIADECGDKYCGIALDKKMILTGEKTLDWKAEFRMAKDKRIGKNLPKEFEYGYAITTHRAQGSEWDNVLVIEEDFPFEKEEHARWLYTSCTRARKRLVLVLKD